MALPILRSSTAVPPRMTYQEFLQWSADGIHAEWDNGEVIFMTVRANNNRIQVFLLNLLGAVIDASTDGELFCEPFQMKTGPDLPGRSPDIFFVRRDRCDIVRDHHIEGPADLVIEIVSPDSAVRDRVDTYYEYEQGGVREYWLIDPMRKTADFYVRDADGYFRAAPVDASGVYHCHEFPLLSLRIDWLWQSPLPHFMTAIKEMGLI